MALALQTDSTRLVTYQVRDSLNGTPINNSTVNNIITTYGFIQIPLGPAGSGLPNSRCRKNP